MACFAHVFLQLWGALVLSRVNVVALCYPSFNHIDAGTRQVLWTSDEISIGIELTKD